MRWHQKNVADVIEELNSSLQGLSSEEARRRLREYGPNELKQKKKKTPLMMFIDQFRDFMILVLIAAALVSGFIGVNRTGKDGNGIRYPGASHIFDPLGNDICAGGPKEQFLVCEIDTEEVVRVRSRFPFLNDMRS